MNSIIKFFFVFLLLNIALPTISQSEVFKVTDIKVSGNKRIATETIYNIAGLKKNSFSINSDELNSVQKKLFESSFFSKVNVKVENSTISIFVTENPIVDYVSIEGLEKNPDYLKFIESKNVIKGDSIFSESLLKKDINQIKDYLRTLGYFNSQVLYKVNKQDKENRVNIFFEIKLNNQFLVKNIFFIGDKKISSSKLLDVISTTQYSFFNIFNTNSIPSLDRINFDINALKNFYLNQGFYDVQITNSSVEVIDDKYVNIIFSINAGNKFFVSDYVLKNNLSFLQTSQVTALNKIIVKYKNSDYSNKKINDLRTELSKYLDSLNISTDIDLTLTKVSDSKLQIDLSILETNRQKIIKNILVLGNTITEEKVIRNNLLFAEGDTFLQSKIFKSKDNLRSLNIFKSVDIKTDITSNNDVMVNIVVEEKPTGEISSGIGVSSSTGASISFNLKENNFLGQGIYALTSLNIGTQQVLGNISFNVPDFFENGNSLKNSFFITKNSFDNVKYENKVIGNNISTRYEIFQDINFEHGFGINYDSIDSKNSTSVIISQQDGEYLTTKYFYNFLNDKRNQKFKPTSGYTVGFGQDLALPPSDVSYLSNNFFGSFYYDFNDDFVTSILYRVRSINSFDSSDTIKFSDRLYLSSSQLRGFANRSVGPVIGGDHIGGNYAFNTTIATTLPNGSPETWNLTSSIFLDAGNVWGVDINNVSDTNKLRSSLGIGFSWVSPIGPITISYAEPISKDSLDEVEKFNFSLGSRF